MHFDRGSDVWMFPNPQHCGDVLADEDQTTDHQDEAELTHGDVCFMRHAGVEPGADDGESDHDAEMDEFGQTFEERVDAEADVVEHHLQPREPEDGEETDVGCYRCV